MFNSAMSIRAAMVPAQRQANLCVGLGIAALWSGKRVNWFLPALVELPNEPIQPAYDTARHTSCVGDFQRRFVPQFEEFE
jgi:hypothetical protein